MRALPITAVILLTTACSAQYSGPESVEYDPTGDRYFVSCTGSSSIRLRAQDGTVTDFVTGLADAAYGIELMGDTLFACEGGAVKGYRTSDAAEVFSLDLGGSFLNGITHDDHFIYTTDFSAKKIFKVDPAAGTFTTLVTNTVITPNGIINDPIGHRLIVVAWGTNAAIKAVDPGTGAITPLVNTTVSNIDGVTIDCHGNIIIASWSPDRLTSFEPTFTAPGVDLGATGLNNPADISFDPVHGLVCVPNAGSNAVTFFALPDCNVAVREVPGGDGYTTVLAYPNPTDGLVHIDLPLTQPTPFMVLNARGTLVASGTLRPHAMLDVAQLATGVYLIDLPSIKRYVRVVKN